MRLAKDRKKGDKIVSDSQERAYWRAYRPPPGCLNCLEHPPLNRLHLNPTSSASAAAAAAASASRRKLNSIADIKAEVCTVQLLFFTVATKNSIPSLSPFFLDGRGENDEIEMLGRRCYLQTMSFRMITDASSKSTA